MDYGLGIDASRFLASLPLPERFTLLDVENWMDPAFCALPSVERDELLSPLRIWPGDLLLSGPYIDLNPGTADPDVREVTMTRVRDVIASARKLGAGNIVFLSTLLPQVRLAFYEDAWVARSGEFWSEVLDDLPPSISIAIANTFETTPRRLAELVTVVDHPRFQLAFDLGHYLIYAEEKLEVWLDAIAQHTSIAYVHSNDGHLDDHLMPGQGILRPDHLILMAERLPRLEHLVLKPRNLETIQDGVTWMTAALAQTST